MPANENGAHMLINTSNVPLVYLEVKTSTTPEICIQPEAKKFVPISGLFFGKAFKISSDVNYLADC